MSRLFYSKLAISNINKNKKVYFPYILTSIFSVMMYYLIHSLSSNKGLLNLPGGDTAVMILKLGRVVVFLFCIIFLFYTNSFLIKRRKKEFGLFNILGMDKFHISRIIFLETLIISVISLVFGVGLGILFDKVLFLSLIRLIGESVPLGFTINYEVIINTITFFSTIFLAILLYSVFQISISKPIELLKGGDVGEKEPKSKWILGLMGLICLAIGYYIALTTTNAVAAIMLFFVAVILVIIGTYLIFNTTSIILLKLLRKNKNYYYKTNHFISISSMIYRMKQNAVGLANICILSTMILVMVSSTTSLWIGVEDMINERHPYEIDITYPIKDIYETADLDTINQTVDRVMNEYNLNKQNTKEYISLYFSVVREKNQFKTDRTSTNVNYFESVFLMSVADFNKLHETNYTLSENEILIYNTQREYEYYSLEIFNETYQVKEVLESFDVKGSISAHINPVNCVVVHDLSIIEKMYLNMWDEYNDNALQITYNYMFDLDGDKEELIEVYQTLGTEINSQVESVTIESRSDGESAFKSLYAGFFFIGIFLSIMFIMAAILIMYYKQISEGYDDKNRFEIMQKVGLSNKEVKNTIKSQILTVFFLPLVVAGVHVAVALPFILRILKLLYLTNSNLYVIVTVVCFVVFSVFYGIVYSLTSRTYYKIINQR